MSKSDELGRMFGNERRCGSSSPGLLLPPRMSHCSACHTGVSGFVRAPCLGAFSCVCVVIFRSRCVHRTGGNDTVEPSPGVITVIEGSCALNMCRCNYSIDE